MIMNLVAIGIVGIVAYIWVLQGFFSALLHMACVLIAGAIAFAFWEPLAYMILTGVEGNKGFLSFLPGMAWGVALVVPFAVSLALMRFIVDKAIPAKAQVAGLAERLGGGVCGAVSGAITAGIVVMGISMLWMDTGWWYQRLDKNANGRLERTTKLWVPVDDIVAGIYGGMSRTTLSTDYSLARMYPNLADVPSSMRHTLFDGKGRPTISPKHFEVLGGFTIGTDETFAGGFESAEEAKRAISGGDTPFKPITDLDGNALDVAGSYIVGYSLAFESTARERGSSQVVVGAPQLRLVCENDAGESREVFPFSFMSRAEAARGDDTVRYVRFDFIMGDFPATFQESKPKMAFEFLVPQGFKPAWLYVKNARVDVRPNESDVRYEALTPSQRSTRVSDKTLIEMTARVFDDADAVTVNIGTDPRSAGIDARSALPMGMIIRDGDQRSLRTDEQKRVVDGEQNWNANALDDNRGLDKALRVSEFAIPPISDLVQVTVTPTSRLANPAINLTELPLSSAPTGEPIYLVDAQGYAFACIGFAYKDRQEARIRYTRSNVLGGLDELPSVPSRSRRDQEIVLLFEVQKGRQIAGVAIGDKIYLKFDPPIVVSSR